MCKFSFNHYINIKMKSLLILAIFLAAVSGKLVFEDNFDRLDFKKWKHDITLSGGGNWEF